MQRFDQDHQGWNSGRFQKVSRAGFPQSLLDRGQRALRSVCGLTMVAGLLAACQTTDVPPPQAAAKPAEPVVAEPAPVVEPEINETRVAILLPLSGQAASVGQSLLNAAQMAMFDLGNETYTLNPYDTQGTAEGATMAAQQAIEAGAQVILGPLFGHSVTAAAAVAQPVGVPVISYSTNPDVAQPGVYVAGFLLRDQARRLVEEALGRGLSRFALFTPNTAYGTQMGNAFTQAVLAQAPNAVLISQEVYDPSDTQDMVKAAKRLLPNGDGVPGFDVVMVAEAGQKLHEAMALLTYAGLNTQQTKVVGPMLWNDRRVFNERTLQGAWFPAPPPSSHDAFARRYQAAFGEPAPSIAGLGYDTAAVTAVLGRQPLAEGQSTPFTSEALTSVSGFAGVDGVFRLRTDGTSERGLAVMEINQGNAYQIGAAPKSFAAPAQANY